MAHPYGALGASSERVRNTRARYLGWGADIFAMLAFFPELENLRRPSMPRSPNSKVSASLLGGNTCLNPAATHLVTLRRAKFILPRYQ
ncbi:protein of unknown function [Hyphomicrobium sp. MC1]|nr:protein of unknown function [Hyphomicrobium sp. MC1]